MADLSTELSTTLHDRTRYYKSPTLETVLANYGYHKSDEEDFTFKKKEKKSTRPPIHLPLASIRGATKSANVKKNKKEHVLGEDYVFQEEDPYEELARLRIKDAYLIRLLSEAEQERYFSHVLHKEKVEAKVEQQREAALLRKRREKELEKRRKAKEFTNSHHIKKRLERVMLNHNDEFIDTVPKSAYYKILQVEKEMKQQGLLRTPTERDHFWSQHLRKAGLMHKKSLDEMNLGKTINDAVKSSTKNNGTKLDCVDEVEEEKARPEVPHKIAPLDRYSLQMISKIFPKMDFPKLHCYELNLSDERLSQEELRQLEYVKRQEQRLFKKRLNTKMYQLALSHGTMTQRILNEQFDADTLAIMQGEYNNLGNLVPERLSPKTRQMHHEVNPLDAQRNNENGNYLPTNLQHEPLQSSLPSLSHLSMTRNFKTIEEENSVDDSKTASIRLLKSDIGSHSASSSRKPLPLSLLELQRQCTVLNAVKPSSFWTNYANNGVEEDDVNQRL